LGADPNTLIPKQLKQNSVCYTESNTALVTALMSKEQTNIFLLLMRQENKPISCMTLGLLLAFSMRSDALKTNEAILSLNFHSTEFHLAIIEKLITFSKETRIAIIHEANQKANLCYKEKNYPQALLYFYVCVLFDDYQLGIRESSAFRLGDCYIMMGQTILANEYYQVHGEYELIQAKEDAGTERFSM
jgi:hypothetical protein